MRRKSNLLLIVGAGVVICGFIVITSFHKSTRTTQRLQAISNSKPDDTQPLSQKEDKSPFAYDDANENEYVIVKEEKVLADPNAKGCTFESVNPFDKTMMKHMFDLGSLECPKHLHHVKTFSNATHLRVVGEDIEELKFRQVTFTDDGFFSFGEYKQIMQKEIAFNKGASGVIRNEASNRCISPEPNKEGNSDTLELKYTSSCSTKEVIFSMEKNGAIKHEATGFCMTPSVKPPVDNTPLVLKKDCSSTFTILSSGMIKFDSSEMCVHPLWGGIQPMEGQKLCLWSDCNAAARLQYHLYEQPTTQDKEIVRKMTIEAGELSVLSNKTQEDNFLFLNLLSKDINISNNEGINIIVISLDEVSEAHFQRKLPNTFKYMEDEMKFMFYHNYASISNMAIDNIIALLNGGTESAEASIYKIASEKGYVTLFASDDGIKKGILQAHHDPTAFLNALVRKTGISQCFQGEKKFDITFQYLNTFIKTYSHPKFAFVAFNSITKSNYNFIGYLDESLKAFLHNLHALKKTFVVINSIKGSLAGRLGHLDQGRAEYRKPLFGLYFSDDIKNEYKMKDHKVLITPFDIHLTLIELITKTRRKHANGYSLFEDTIPNRNCYQASVLKNMCPCK